VFRLERNWFAVSRIDGDLLSVVGWGLVGVGRLGGGARLVCLPYTEDTEFLLVEHVEFRRVLIEFPLAAVNILIYVTSITMKGRM